MRSVFPLNQIIHGDCLEVMPAIPDKSIDMILCDLPYGTTACKWDTVIPFEPLWKEYKRLVKDNGVIVLTATEPFASLLRISNLSWYKYDWVWDKVTAKGHLVAKKRPMAQHEMICVFYVGSPNYKPAMVERDKPVRTKECKRTEIMGGESSGYTKMYTHSYPKTILEFSGVNHFNILHPTQKPVPLFEYLIKTYTNEGETVLDNCIGSGTTAIACINTGRNFVGIEKNEEHFKKAVKRVEKHKRQEKMKLITNAEITKMEEKTLRKLRGLDL